MHVPYSPSEQSIIHSPYEHLGSRWFFSRRLPWHGWKPKHRRYHHALANYWFLQQQSTRHPHLDIRHRAALEERDLSLSAPLGVIVVLSWSQQGTRTFIIIAFHGALMFYYGVRGWHNPRENITFIIEKNLSDMLPVLLNNFFLFLFFLLSLFAPLNGIQQLEDISDTWLSGSFYLPCCALWAQFLCDTALPSWCSHLHEVCNQRRIKFFLPGKSQVAVEC